MLVNEICAEIEMVITESWESYQHRLQNASRGRNKYEWQTRQSECNYIVHIKEIHTTRRAL